ncbi:MAG: hypothetical protein NTU80_04115 [Verrucomicrobia bacterium]|nr:hypothetical protein [Verrucomicrobiota bacterium]
MNDSFIKSIIAIITLNVILVQLSAHDNLTIHPMIMGKAFESWLDSESGLESFKALEIKSDDKFDYTPSAINGTPPSLLPVNHGVGTDKYGKSHDIEIPARPPWTLKEWMVAGAVDEDAPDLRCLGHFYNPLKPNHALSDPLTLGAPDSFSWAKGENNKYVTANEESWAKARKYYYDALTLANQEQRDASLAHTFYALGKICHLLQDLSQPEHVRNDAHMVNGAETPILGRSGVMPNARWIENFGSEKKNLLKEKIGSVPTLNWRAAKFTKVEDFWNRSLYTGSNPAALDDDASGDVTKTLGLSEFINGNFLGADASYKELVSAGTSHYFEHPALTDTNYASFGISGKPLLTYTWTSTATTNPDNGKIRRSVFLRKERSGIHVEKHAALNYSLLYRLRTTGITQDYPTYPGVTINAPDVLQEYHEKILPKAVSYSAGLLDYFFRGKLETRLRGNEYAYKLQVTNKSGQPLNGGAFKLYSETTNGARTLVNLTPAASWTEQSSLENDRSLEFTFNTETDLVDSYILIYKGTIGDGQGNAKDPVDAGNAVAAARVYPCDAPLVEIATRSASKTKNGYRVLPDFYSTRPKRYLNASTVEGIWLSIVTGPCIIGRYYYMSGDGVYDPDTDTYSGITVRESVYGSGTPSSWPVSYVNPVRYVGDAKSSTRTETFAEAYRCSSEDPSATFSAFNEYTTATFKTNTIAALSSWSSWIEGFTDVPSESVLACNELNYTIREVKYRLRHRLTKRSLSTGCYKVTWLERAIPALTYSTDCTTITGGGVAVTSIEVLSGGAGYRTATATAYLSGDGVDGIYFTDAGNGYASAPTVTLSAPEDPLGTTATATVTLDGSGSIDTFTVTNSGTGYVAAPIVTIAAPSGGATPTLTISAPGSGGTTATATATLAADGTISSVALGSAGTRYLSAPFVTISSPHGLGIGAELLVHLGTETAKEYVWDGETPEDYDDEDPETWPLSDEYPLPIPTSNGTLYVPADSIRYSCDVCP